ncbi:MAG: Rpn family recombination-promoting nuclease/putative transposase [Firmicutes bacterium]|nr:Rpn family recombination-promoting nuclease/putative transposase [Bacillota bacterium]
MDYLLPTSDYVFKRIFGDPNNLYDILADFLKAVIPDLHNNELEKIILRDTHVLPNIQDDKFCILDVMVELKSGKLIDIEVQVINRKDMEQRTCFYLSHLVSSQLSSGERYKNIKLTIAIIITKYDWIKDSKSYHNTYKFFDKENNSYFGDTMTIHTIELTKLKNDDAKNELYNWIKFFNAKSKEEFKMASDTSEAIAKAVKKVEQLSLDENARKEYEMREKALKDYNSVIFDAKAEGIKEGIEKGVKEGIKEGEMKGKIEAVVELILETKMPVDKAMKILKIGFSHKKQVEEELRKRGV